MRSSSGLRMLVGSYASAAQPGLFSFVVDESAADLQLELTLAGVANPSFLAMHPSRDYLFAVSETGLRSDGAPGGIHAYRIEREQGQVGLVPLNRRSTGGDHPCHLSLDSGGQWLAVSNYGSGDVAVFPIESGGRLGEMRATARHSGSGPHPHRQESPHAHSSLFTADGRFLLVADLGIDRIVIYEFGSNNGSLVLHGDVATAPGAGPRHLAFHPKGDHLMVVNELDSSITLYGYDARAGSLRELQTLSTVPPHAGENTAADICVSSLGTHVYVSNRGHDSVAVFAFDPGHGLRRTAIRSCGGVWPRGLGLVPGGRHLVAANRRSDEIVVLPLLGNGSDIGEPIARVAVAQPTSVVFAW